MLRFEQKHNMRTQVIDKISYDIILLYFRINVMQNVTISFILKFNTSTDLTFFCNIISRLKHNKNHIYDKKNYFLDILQPNILSNLKNEFEKGCILFMLIEYNNICISYIIKTLPYTRYQNHSFNHTYVLSYL